MRRGVVEAVDVLEEREVRFGPGREDAAADALGLDQHPQALRQGIVERVTDRSHGRLNTGPEQACCEFHRRVLTAVVGVVDELAGGDFEIGRASCRERV